MYRRAHALLSASATSFQSLVQGLKKKYRGMAQYKEAQQAATEVLATIPSTLEGWISEENATAALNGFGFFEIMNHPQLPVMREWATKHITEFKSPHNIVMAALALHQVTAFEGREALNAFLVAKVFPVLRSKLAEMELYDFESTVKLFQRCKVEDESVWEEVCGQIMMREDTIQQSYGQVSAVRLFTAVARFAPKNPVAESLLAMITSQLPALKSYDFSSLVSAVERYHGAHPQSPALVEKLMVQLGNLPLNARDMGVAFPCCVRMYNSFAETAPSDALVSLTVQLNSVLENVKARVHLHITTDHKLYWAQGQDIVNIVFSYETVSRVEHRDLFMAFRAYIATQLDSLAPHFLALTLGVLRRTGLLQEGVESPVWKRVRPRLESQATTFNFDELSHIALCALAMGDAALLTGPLLDAVKRLATTKDAVLTAAAMLNFSVAYAAHGGTPSLPVVTPSRKANASKSSDLLASVSVRQLVDAVATLSTAACPATPETPAAAAHATITAGISTVLNDRMPEATNADLLYLSTVSNLPDTVIAAAIRETHKRLDEEKWGPTTLRLIGTKQANVTHVDRAMAAAKLVCQNAAQFVIIAEGMLRAFPNHPKVQRFLRAGCDRMVQDPRSFRYVVTYLRSCHALHPEMLPDLEWLQFFIYNPLSSRFDALTLDVVALVFDALEHAAKAAAAHPPPPPKVVAEPSAGGEAPADKPPPTPATVAAAATTNPTGLLPTKDFDEALGPMALKAAELADSAVQAADFVFRAAALSRTADVTAAAAKVRERAAKAKEVLPSDVFARLSSLTVAPPSSPSATPAPPKSPAAPTTRPVVPPSAAASRGADAAASSGFTSKFSKTAGPAVPQPQQSPITFKVTEKPKAPSPLATKPVFKITVMAAQSTTVIGEAKQKKEKPSPKISKSNATTKKGKPAKGSGNKKDAKKLAAKKGKK